MSRRPPLPPPGLTGPPTTNWVYEMTPQQSNMLRGKSQRKSVCWYSGQMNWIMWWLRSCQPLCWSPHSGPPSQVYCHTAQCNSLHYCGLLPPTFKPAGPVLRDGPRQICLIFGSQIGFDDVYLAALSIGNIGGENLLIHLSLQLNLQSWRFSPEYF